MAVALWSAVELQRLGNAVKDFEELVQGWEAEHDIKIDSLLVRIENRSLAPEVLGVISILTKNDTVLQFEAGA